jgi:hypothetical protein
LEDGRINGVEDGRAMALKLMAWKMIEAMASNMIKSMVLCMVEPMASKMVRPIASPKIMVQWMLASRMVQRMALMVDGKKIGLNRSKRILKIYIGSYTQCE